MISKDRLLAAVNDGKVALDTEGNPVDLADLGGDGPATLVVTSVTDAVKRLRGDVVESLDRDRMWVVVAIVLAQEVLETLGPDEMSAEELWRAVTGAGYTWRISPTSSL